MATLHAFQWQVVDIATDAGETVLGFMLFQMSAGDSLDSLLPLCQE